MRLPAVAIAVAFAGGIAMGWPAIHLTTSTSQLLVWALGAAVFFLVASRVLFSHNLSAAGLTSLFAWFSLGVAGGVISQEPKPANYVVGLADAGAFDLHTPLRWHGQLRDEPERLPWGFALEVELSSVDFAERNIPLRGGMRLNYTPREGALLPEAHAGDGISVVAQARLPQVFRDEGAFDRRAYLRDQGIDLTATLRAPELLEIVSPGPPTASSSLARVRRRLREELSASLPAAPQETAVLRAMLLGDRSFLDRSESVDFQKTGVFHVLVVAGLHVGAFAAFLFWLAQRLRLSRAWTSLAVILCVAAYVTVVEQRPPVLRAALMTFVVIVAMFFFRRVELLNSVGLAALILLVASPRLLEDSSFQLSFLAMFCIAGLAAPWLERNIEPYTRGVRGWRDVARDVSHPPRVAQFRIDLRTFAAWIESKLPSSIAPHSTDGCARLLVVTLRVAEMLVLTFVLQAGMLPLLARDFHRITLSGLLANLIAVPLTGVLVPLGFLTLAAALLIPKAAMVLSIPLDWLTGILLHSMSWIAHFPRWSYRVPAPPLWLILLFFTAAIILACTLRFPSTLSKWLQRISLGSAIAAALLIATHPFSPRSRHGWLELNVLDVGQGDSLFLVSPTGHTILVDAAGPFNDPYHPGQSRGSDPGEDAVSPYLWSRGFQRVDVVALTHAHQDHLGGLAAVFENFKVGTLWIGREVAVQQQQQLEALAASKGTRVFHELRGEHIDWDGTQVDFLWPEIAPEEVAPSAKNDDSLVFRIRYGERSFLLPGDAEKAAERAILSENAPESLQSDVLKIGHHGSKNSTTPDFLNTVQPRLAVISAGEENPYGHPSPALIERLQLAEVPILRTDVNGAIHIATNGKRFDVSCFVACPRIGEQLNRNSGRPEVPLQQENHQQQ